MWIVRQYAKNTYKDNGYIIEGAKRITYNGNRSLLELLLNFIYYYLL